MAEGSLGSQWHLKVIASLVLGYFFFPYLYVLKDLDWSNLNLNIDDVAWALKNTILQSVLSSVMTLFCGVLGAFGFLWLRQTLKPSLLRFFENLILLPSLMPALFVVLSCFSVFRPFPYGLGGITLIHSLMTTGFIAILLGYLYQSRLGALSELALIEGASSWTFFRYGILGYLKKDHFYIFLFLISFFLGSFSIPMLAGGQRGTTLEVYIYETLLLRQNWSAAVGLSLIQWLLVLSLAWVSNRIPSYRQMSFGDRSIELLQNRWMIVFLFLPVFIVLGPPLFSLRDGWLQFEALRLSTSSLVRPLLNSILLSVSVGFWVLILNLAVLYTIEISWCRRWLLSASTPSTILVGLVFYGLSHRFLISAPVASIFALGFLFFPSLFKLNLAANLKALKGQIESALILGAGPGQIATEILWPLLANQILFMSGMASLWATGDFAITSILSNDKFHLGLWIKSLANSYRLDLAMLLVFVLYFFSLGVFWIWREVSDVFDRKY